MDMSQWKRDLINSKEKKPMPILSYPAVQKPGVTVRELVGSSGIMAECVVAVAADNDLSASVSFMDLSVEAECFGCEAIIYDYDVPAIGAPIVSGYKDADKLRVPKIGDGRSGICLDAIEKIKKAVTDRPVFAGCIGPFSLAGRMMGVSDAMLCCYDEPETLELILQKGTQFITDYIKAFKRSGADGVILCEPLSGMVSPSHEEEFSAPYIRQIADAAQDQDFLVIYHNCGDFTHRMTRSLSENGCGAYHFGEAVELGDMLGAFPSDLLVMGNISPSSLFAAGKPEDMRSATEKLMKRCAPYKNFVPSSGCDIPPQSPWENIMAFIDSVNSYYKSAE
jgi:uroporphyrinogen decarboxylase